MTADDRRLAIGLEALADDSVQSSVELLESLRRISLSVGSNLGLDTVLQTIVDAVCDHTQWQLCWINEVHVSRGFAEVVARRDKLDYTLESRERNWDLQRIPTMDALRSNQPISLPDISSCTEYPDYCEDAVSRGAVAGVVIPLSTTDPGDLPRVLCVQSPLPLLGDARQLPFLRTVAGMASLAVRNARQSDNERRAMLASTESVAMISFMIEHLVSDVETSDIYAQLERLANTSFIVLDGEGALAYAGRSPISYDMPDDTWRVEVGRRASWLSSLFPDQGSGGVPSVVADAGTYLPIPDSFRMVASRLPGLPSLGGLLTISREDVASHVHDTLVAAVGTVMLRDQIRFEVERELNADALSALFAPGPSNDPTARRRAAAFGVDIAQPNTLVLIRPAQELATGANRLRFVLSAVIQRWPGSTVHSANSDLVVFLPGNEDDALQGRLTTLHSCVVQSTRESDFYMVWSGPCETRSDYPKAWDECLTALDLAQKLGRHDLVNLREFGSYRFLLSALAEQDIEGYIQRTIGLILDHDVNHNGEMLKTVEAFLFAGGRLQETARRLHIHVSTLRYRLDRIKALIGQNLADDDIRFEMSLAVRLHRLRLLHAQRE